MRRLSIITFLAVPLCISVTAQSTRQVSARDESGIGEVDIVRSFSSLSRALTSSRAVPAVDAKVTAAQRPAPQLAVPQLVDPGFEAFSPARAPLYGWYSDELIDKGNGGSRLVTMTRDNKNKVEGEYSLHIDQMQPPPRHGQVFLAQALRLPEKGKINRSFDLSVQMRGQADGPVMIDVYVWEPDTFARVIAKRKVAVTGMWSSTTVSFKVPRGYETFGVWFYLPRDEEAQLWLDDVRLQPGKN